MNSAQSFVKQYSHQAVKDLLYLTQVKSVKSQDQSGYIFGKSVHEAFDRFEAICQSLALDRVSRFDDYYAWVEVGNPELDMMGLICHIDVVNYDPSQWQFDPKGEVTADTIYGRGVSDNKGPLIMALYLLRYIKQQNLPLRVRLIVGGDEESEFLGVKKYLANDEETPVYGIVPDAKFPLIISESSIWNFTVQLTKHQLGISEDAIISSGIGHNSIPDFAKIKEADQEKIFRGETGHVMNYEKSENALIKLMNRCESTPGTILDKLHKITADQYYNFSFQGEDIHLVPTVLKTEGNEAQLTFDIRAPEHLDIQSIKSAVLDFLGAEDRQIMRENIAQGYRYTENHPVVQSLLENYTDCLEEFGEEDQSASPLEIKGTTYAKYFPNCITYGPGFPGEHSFGHRADERITIQSFRRAFYIYLKAFEKFAK